MNDEWRMTNDRSHVTRPGEIRVSFLALCLQIAIAMPKQSDPVQTSLLAITQTAVGCGIGLLIAGKLGRPAQKTTAATMISVGALLALPVLVGVVVRSLNGPESARGARRRLNSIRHDHGFTEEAEVV